MLTKEQFAKVNKIMGLTLLINEQGKYCAFLNLNGHIDNIEIAIRSSKKNYQEKVADAEFKLKPPTWGNKTLDERYDEVILTLEKFLEEDSIPYEYLAEIERIEYDYKF